MADLKTSNTARPIAATGIGLRHCHIQDFLQHKPAVAWLEILADNHLEAGGPVKQALEIIRQDYAFSFHCVGMSLGGTDPLDVAYLKRVGKLIQSLEPGLVSDHLSFSSVHGRHYHELLPLPYTEESLNHVCQRILQVQDYLRRRILVENPSSYFTYQHSTIDEWEFMAAMARQADCQLLLDVNNIYVSACNHGFDAQYYVEQIPCAQVHEVHLAGFDTREGYLLDAHNNPVAAEVWQLFGQLMQQAPHIPALIEWDNDIPALAVLQEQARQAEHIRQCRQTDHAMEMA